MEGREPAAQALVAPADVSFDRNVLIACATEEEATSNSSARPGCLAEYVSSNRHWKWSRYSLSISEDVS